MEKKQKRNLEPDIMDLVTLDFEKQKALEMMGEDETYGIWGILWKIRNRGIRRHEPKQINKKKYLMILLAFGWMGGHRYYEKRWGLGIIYTLFFWTGIPLGMTVIDAIYVIPLKTNHQGMIFI